MITIIILKNTTCIFWLLVCEGRQYIKDVLVDGQSHLLIIREETELPGAQVSEVRTGVSFQWAAFFFPSSRPTALLSGPLRWPAGWTLSSWSSVWKTSPASRKFTKSTTSWLPTGPCQRSPSSWWALRVSDATTPTQSSACVGGGEAHFFCAWCFFLFPWQTRSAAATLELSMTPGPGSSAQTSDAAPTTKHAPLTASM